VDNETVKRFLSIARADVEKYVADHGHNKQIITDFDRQTKSVMGSKNPSREAIKATQLWIQQTPVVPWGLGVNVFNLQILVQEAMVAAMQPA